MKFSKPFTSCALGRLLVFAGQRSSYSRYRGFQRGYVEFPAGSQLECARRCLTWMLRSAEDLAEAAESSTTFAAARSDAVSHDAVAHQVAASMRTTSSPSQAPSTNSLLNPNVFHDAYGRYIDSTATSTRGQDHTQ